MLKRLKIFLLLVFICALALCVLVGGAIVFIDPNDYKTELAEYIYEKTGRKTVFEGQLELKVLPELKISTGAWYMENPAEFGGGHFLSVKSSAIELAPLSIIFGDMEVRNVALYGARLNLRKAVNGKANWEAPKDAAVAEAQGTEAQGPGGADGTGDAGAIKPAPQKGRSLKWQVKLFAVEKAQITYSDLGQTGVEGKTDYTIALNKLEVHDFVPEGDASFELDLTANDAHSGHDLALRLKGYGRYSPGTDSIKCVLPQFFAQLQHPDFTTPQNFSGRMEIKGQPIAQKGDILLEVSSPNLDFTLKAAAEPHTAKAGEKFSLLSMLPDLKASFTFDSYPASFMAETGHPLQLSNPESLGKVSGSFSMDYGAGIINVPDIVLNVDSTKFTGSKKVELSLGQGGLRARAEASLQGDKLNLDDYLPANAPAKAPGESQGEPKGELKTVILPGYDPATLEAKAAEEARIAAETAKEKTELTESGLPPWLLEWLQRVDFTASLDMDELVFCSLPAQRLKMKFSGKKNALKMDSLACELLQGKLTAEAGMKLEAKAISATLQFYARGLDLAQIPLEPGNHLQGQFELEVDLASQVKRLDDLLPGLYGRGRFAGQKLEYSNPHGQYGFVTAEIFNLFPAFKQLESLDAFKSVESLEGSFRINKAVLNNRDLNAKSGRFSARGSGSFDILKATLDYNLLISTPEYRNIPIDMQGAYPNFTYNLNKEKALRSFGEKVLGKIEGLPAEGLKAGEKALKAGEKALKAGEKALAK